MSTELEPIYGVLGCLYCGCRELTAFLSYSVEEEQIYSSLSCARCRMPYLDPISESLFHELVELPVLDFLRQLKADGRFGSSEGD